MSKDLTFRVELSFSGKVVSDEEVMEIAQKIANSLEHEVNTGGLAPEDSDVYTEHIRVTPQYLDKTIIVSF